MLLMILSGLDIGNADGGREKFSIALCRHLNKDEFQVSICAFWQRQSAVQELWRSELEKEGIDVFFVADAHARFRTYQLVRGILRILSRCSREPVDIVHSHYQTGTITAVLLKLLGSARSTMRTVHTSSLKLGEWEGGLLAWLSRQFFTNWLFPWLLNAEVGLSKMPSTN
jgi:hypothetical protein